jgi:biopolymer transport protein ExbD|tara:strand:+ start:1014 stop:1313 length:300 start_codon:yes stop_codon:yes gene_type:complete
MWKNLKNIQIPGSIWSPLLVGTMLGITGGLFITLPISRTNDNTLGESIFGKNESLELQIKIENEGELHLKATGATTMDLVQSLKKMLPDSERNPLEELY